MQTRQQAITYGLSFPHTYVEAPFKDPNWELVRVKGSKKAFLWIYEKDGYINLNIKVDPEWRDFWREAYDAVIPGYHQNKKYWNTIILDADKVGVLVHKVYDALVVFGVLVVLAVALHHLECPQIHLYGFNYLTANPCREYEGA